MATPPGKRAVLAPVVAACVLAAAARSAGAEADWVRSTTDAYLFARTLAEFGAARAEAPHADVLDWSSDGCSKSPDEPLGFKFLPACHRHDFGYRNYKRQGRFDERARRAIDERFRLDLYDLCGGNWFCNRSADVYVSAVRQFGGLPLPPLPGPLGH